MELINYPRFINAIEEAIQGLELEARCYGYIEDPEHTELVELLQKYKTSMEAKQDAQERLLKALFGDKA